MQIHYRPHGDHNTVQLKLFIFIALPDLERKRALSRLFYFSYFDQIFFMESSSLSSRGIPESPSPFFHCKRPVF